MRKNLNIDDPHLKENPFKVPDGYFTRIEGEIWDKIHADSGFSFHKIFKPAIALAASFAIIFAFGWGIMKLTESSSSLSTDEGIMISDYIKSRFENISIDSLDDYAPYGIESDELNNDQDEYAYEEEIEQYLIETNTSILTIALLENDNW